MEIFIFLIYFFPFFMHGNEDACMSMPLLVLCHVLLMLGHVSCLLLFHCFVTGLWHVLQSGLVHIYLKRILYKPASAVWHHSTIKKKTSYDWNVDFHEISTFSISESREDIFICKSVNVFLCNPWKSSLHSHLVYYISHRLCREEANCFGTVSLSKELQTGPVTCCYFRI